MTQVTGQQGTEDEWTRMKQHKGDAARQIRHLAATCTFAWLARNWGYETTVLPRPGATPEFDILLENYYRRHMPRVHVEVQGLHGDPEKRKRKWRAMAKAQGRVAICTERMRDAEDLGHEAWSVTGRRVVVASLDALLRARESQDFRPNNLWVLTL